jgi:hypothetical protein
MKYKNWPLTSVLLISFAAAIHAAQPWSKDSSQWTTQDAQRILDASPWAQSASALFPDADPREQAPVGPLPGAAQAGMAGPHGVNDGVWDGGVGRVPRGGVPALSVTIRWDSALPVREASLRLRPAAEAGSPTHTPAQVQKDYIITVLGLVPARGYRNAGQLPTQSRSDDDTTIDAHDPEQMLEGLMAQSRLMPRGRKPIAPEDVKLDSATGALHLFFPRTELIELNDKEVMFATRFGSMTIQKQFRLKDMIYRGKLEL